MEYEVEITRVLRVRVNTKKGPAEAIDIATKDYNLAEYEVTTIQVVLIVRNSPLTTDPHDQ